MYVGISVSFFMYFGFVWNSFNFGIVGFSFMVCTFRDEVKNLVGRESIWGFESFRLFVVLI